MITVLEVALVNIDQGFKHCSLLTDTGCRYCFNAGPLCESTILTEAKKQAIAVIFRTELVGLSLS